MTGSNWTCGCVLWPPCCCRTVRPKKKSWRAAWAASASVLATPQMQMPGSAPNASLPFWSEDDIRRNAPRLPSEGPPGLPPYLQQEGLLDLDSALWLWLGYRSEQWQRADVRISHLVGRTGSWYWTLEIILPIPGLPGLEVRGLAHAVARVPAANACRQAGPNDPPPMSGMPPSHAPARRAAEAPHTEEPEAKRRMGEVQGMACRKDPSRMSVSLPVAPVPPPAPTVPAWRSPQGQTSPWPR